MKGRLRLAVAVAVLAALAVVVTTAIAGSGKNIRERLTGYEEDPLALSTTGKGKFEARVDKQMQEISYELSYRNLEGAVTQAHIHFGDRHQSGGISVWLCSNLPNPPGGPTPPGTQACPGPSTGSVSGTIVAGDVVGPAGQGIAPGEFAELVAAIKAGATYANVHTSKYASGEIRAQLDRRHKGKGKSTPQY